MLNYRQGLRTMQLAARGKSWFSDFNIFYARMLDLLSNEERFGETQQINHDRARVVEQLDKLALKHMNVTYTELCLDDPNAQNYSIPPPSSPVNTMQPLVTHEASPSSSNHKNAEQCLIQGSAPVDRSLQIGQRWAILVGINAYQDQRSYGNLRYCVEDIRKISQSLQSGGFSPERIHRLTDQDQAPLRENILHTLQTTADATNPEDILLFYFSGHGEMKDGEVYLVPANGRHDSLKYTAIAIQDIKEILKKASARKKVLVLDACHSGIALGARGIASMSADFIERVFEQAEGLAILSACTQGQFSYEWETMQGGVFTYYVLEALQGQADTDQKGLVTVNDVNRYVCGKVRLWANQHQVSQTPTLNYLVVGDIPLVEYGKLPDPKVQSNKDVYPYVGEQEALHIGRVHQELAEQIAALGVNTRGTSPILSEDILSRYRQVPLHAIFLYTTEDPVVEQYISNHWKALDSLSGDVCDIYPSIEQFKHAEDAYDYIDQLHVIHQSGFREYTQLPGLFFWDQRGASEYISFGDNIQLADITKIIRTVFQEIHKDPTLASVARAKTMLQNEDTI
jgi:hypothetical protein